jgi:hypothetical protein
MFGKRFNNESHAFIGDKIGDFSGLPPFLVKHANTNFIKDWLKSSSSSERS